MPIYQSTFEDKRQNPIFCKTISHVGRTKESHTERNGQTQTFRHNSKMID